MKTELEEIKLTVKDLENTVNQLKKEIEELGKKPVKRERLKKYWRVDSAGQVDVVVDTSDNFDHWNFKTYNYFATKQEAEAELQRINLVSEFRAFLEEKLCEEPIDWNNPKQDKVFLLWDYEDQQIRYGTNTVSCSNKIYWTDKNGFDKIQQKFTESELKTILGVK